MKNLYKTFINWLEIPREFEQSIDEVKRMTEIQRVAKMIEELRNPYTKLKSGQYSYWENGRKITKTI